MMKDLDDYTKIKLSAESEAFIKGMEAGKKQERKRIRELMNIRSLAAGIVDEVSLRTEPDSSYQISPTEWQAVYTFPGAVDAVEAMIINSLDDAIEQMEEGDK